MKQQGKYVVVTGGKVLPEQIQKLKAESRVWIAVDSGAEAMLSLGLYPDYLVGDLDSISSKNLDSIIHNEQTQIRRFPPEKDVSDTYLALELIANVLTVETEERPEVIILGALGSRVDHSLANYAIAFPFLGKLDFVFQLENGIAYPAKGECELEFKPDTDYPYFSIFPLSEELKGLTLEGFRYPLSHSCVKQENASLLLSNKITGQTAKIKLLAGKCMIFRMRD